MPIDKYILEVAGEYQPIGTLYQQLILATRGKSIDFLSFGCVFVRVCALIRKGLLEYKYVQMSDGGSYALCRRNRRYHW